INLLAELDEILDRADFYQVLYSSGPGCQENQGDIRSRPLEQQCSNEADAEEQIGCKRTHSCGKTLLLARPYVLHDARVRTRERARIAQCFTEEATKEAFFLRLHEIDVGDVPAVALDLLK